MKNIDILEQVLSDEEGEQLWISEEYAEDAMEAYQKFVEFWIGIGLDIDYWPKASEIEELTGRWRQDEDQGIQEWLDDENRETWYYLNGIN